MKTPAWLHECFMQTTNQYYMEQEHNIMHDVQAG